MADFGNILSNFVVHIFEDFNIEPPLRIKRFNIK